MAQAAILVEVICECGESLRVEGGSLAIKVKPCEVCLEKRWGEGKHFGANEVIQQQKGR